MCLSIQVDSEASDFKNASIRVLISSLTLRNTTNLSSIVPTADAGSSKDQLSLFPWPTGGRTELGSMLTEGDHIIESFVKERVHRFRGLFRDVDFSPPP